MPPWSPVYRLVPSFSDFTDNFNIYKHLEHLQSVLSMSRCENICHIQSSVMYSFATPPIKLKSGQQIGWGGLLITNHLDQSLWWANQKHWAAVRSNLLHSSLQVYSAAVPFYKPQQHVSIMQNQNHCPEPNRHSLDFLHPFSLLCWITYRALLEVLLCLPCQRH
jgi:hypothetical protein